MKIHYKKTFKCLTYFIIFIEIYYELFTILGINVNSFVLNKKM